MNQNISAIILPTAEKGGLFCGNLQGAKQVKILKSKGINTVFTVAAQTGLSYPPNEQINHHIYNFYDSPSFNYYPHFDGIADKINEYRLAGKTVYVHCHMGISRACTATCAHLMKYENMSFQQALEFVRQRRPIVFPNPGFVSQLKRYQTKLSSKNQNQDNQIKQILQREQIQLTQNNNKQTKPNPINLYIPGQVVIQSKLFEAKTKKFTVESLKRYTSLQKEKL